MHLEWRSIRLFMHCLHISEHSEVKMPLWRYCLLYGIFLYLINPIGFSTIAHCAESCNGFQKHIAVYGSSDLLRKHKKEIAERYNIVITEWWKYREAAEIKKINPKIKILFYRDLIGMRTDYDDWSSSRNHPEWFAIDNDNKRIRQKTYGWYLMDCRNEGYREHLIDYVETKLRDYPVFDGVFLDDTVNQINETKFSSEGSTQQHTNFSPQFLSSYHDGIDQILEGLKSRLAERLIFINTNTADYAVHVDGLMSEGFVHGSWQPNELKPHIHEWMNDIKKLESFIQTKKFVLVHSGTKGGLVEEDGTFLLTFASYLLVHDPKTTFCYEATSERNSLPSFYKYMYDLGEPLEAMQKHPIKQKSDVPGSEPNLYTRRFERGLVIVNPNRDRIEYDFSASYFDTHGRIITRMTIPNQSGVILLKSMIPKPPKNISVDPQSPGEN
jgi:hypothetical protein